MRLLEHMGPHGAGTYRETASGRLFRRGGFRTPCPWVKELGYVNDARYAENYIAARIHEKSRQRIFQDLYRKGIGSADATAAWEEVCELETA